MSGNMQEHQLKASRTRFLLCHIIAPSPFTLTRPPPFSLRATVAESKRVIDWLRNKSGIKVKTGALAGKRHDYFKGTSLLSLSPYSSNSPA